jgi:hypothetical protein
MNDHGTEDQAKQPGAVPRDPPDQQAVADSDMWGEEPEEQQDTETETPVPQEPTD